MHALLEGLLGLIAPWRCVGCDQPLDDVGALCASCRAVAERADDPGAVFMYGGPVADAIHRFKYDGRSELAAPLASLMREAALAFDGCVDTLVPVPLHWRRRRARGYDQAALLARALGRMLGIPVRLHGLRRARHTRTQVGLSHEERRQNVHQAFVPGRLGGARRVLLVDDVRTTGATLGSATRALAMGGALEIHSLVLATRVLGAAA